MRKSYKNWSNICAIVKISSGFYLVIRYDSGMSRIDPLHVPFKDVLRFTFHQYKRHKWMVIGAYVAVTLSTMASLLNPFVYAWFIDVASNSEIRAFGTIFLTIVAFVSVSVCRHVFLRAAHFLNCFTDSRVQATIAHETSSKVHRFETEWHSNHFVGSIVTAIKRGRSSAHTFYDQICYEFWPAIFATVATITLGYQKSPMLALFFTIFAVCFVTFSVVVSRYYVLPTNRMHSAQDSILGGVIADSITGSSVVKSFGAENREEMRLLDASNTWQRIARKAWIRINILSLSQNMFSNVGRLLILSYAGYMWSKGEFTVADVMYVMMSQAVLYEYLDNIGNDLNKVTTAINDMEEVVAWKARQPSIVSKSDAKPLHVTEGAIEFRKVNFFYQAQGRPTLVDFTLNIRAGEKVALVGPSGGGKSTVLKLLQRLYEPQNGLIAIDNQSIMECDLSSLRSSMALVPQDPILFHRSLADNIAFAKPDATMDEIREAAIAAQIGDLIESMPNKYETLVGERGIKLSGGERQRVAIARAILANTPILLLDEATSALDSECEEEIQEAIAQAAKGRTMIAIAHRLSTIQSADRIIVLAQGRILEQGAHRELLALSDGLYRRLYESQAKGFLPDHTE
jgi:ATP-binding cassette subfamily B protein